MILELYYVGTLVTAIAHIITTVIGSGVLSLSWAVAQLGWIAGPIAILLFSLITWFTSLLLADCYRSPHPVTGQRNYHYIDAVKATLGIFNSIQFFVFIFNLLYNFIVLSLHLKISFDINDYTMLYILTKIIAKFSQVN